MALPVAHGLIGATVVLALHPVASIKRDWRLLLLGAALAILPDADYFFYLILGLGESWHRTFTHSIAFAIVAGIVAAAFLKTERRRMAVICFFATLSHPILDALTSRNQGGVQLFWPLYMERIRFGMINYKNLIRQAPQPLSEIVIGFIETSVWEFVVFAPIFLIVWGLRKSFTERLTGRNT